MKQNILKMLGLVQTVKKCNAIMTRARLGLMQEICCRYNDWCHTEDCVEMSENIHTKHKRPQEGARYQLNDVTVVQRSDLTFYRSTTIEQMISSHVAVEIREEFYSYFSHDWHGCMARLCCLFFSQWMETWEYKFCYYISLL